MDGRDRRGSLGPNDSRLTHSMKHAQETIREFGSQMVKSSARIILPRHVEEKLESMAVTPLGFVDAKYVTVKANGLAIQVRIFAVEDISINLFSSQISTSFESVKPPTKTVGCSPTRAPRCGLEGI